MDTDKIIAKEAAEIAAALSRTFINALQLRVKVHVTLAMQNGAEEEDLPEIISDAIVSGCELSRRSMIIISEEKKAQKILEERK